jgi:methylglutaconyl-CoA hydratase
MAYKFILTKNVDGTFIITLNRPEKYNAMHGPFVHELIDAINTHASNKEIRVLIINANGKHFCAGGDIEWMQKMGECDLRENVEDARALADLLYQLYSFPTPTIALAHGLVLGGGLGLLAACDMAIATDDAEFQMPEVKIGVTPSMISPYVISCIGEKQTLFYALTGIRFDASRALAIGLIQQMTETSSLLAKGMMIADTLLQNSQSALVSAKALVRRVASEKITQALSNETATHLANLRRTSDAQKGLLAFIEKRKQR